MTRTVCCASAALALLAASCGERQAPRKMQVFVSIAPQACFVERVAGDLVDVHVLVGPGHSPATYAPTPRQVAALQDATVYFRIGVPFENGFLPKLRSIREDLRIVDTRHGIRLRTMGTHDHHHEHEAEPGHTPEDEPTHRAGMKDPHVWLDPKLVKVQAETIRRTLAELDPANRARYGANLEAFHRDLDATDARIRAALAPLEGRTLLAFHPAFGYFADAYGLEQEAIETEGKAPSAKQLAKVIERAKATRAKVVFVQPQFSAASARAIADAIGGAVVPMDPLARDYLKNLEAMAATVRASLP